MMITIREVPQDIERFSGQPVRSSSLTAMAQMVHPCYWSIVGQAVVTDRIPTTDGCWLERLAFNARERSKQNQNRSPGDIYTIIDGKQKLSFLVPHPRFEQLFGRHAVVDYKQHEGEAKEYGFEISYDESYDISYHRLAMGEPMMSQVVTRQVVHEEMVQRAISMLRKFTSPEGVEAAQQIS